MPRMKSHPNELPPPEIELGNAPDMNSEVARIWLADEANGEGFITVLRARSKRPDIYAFIIARLAEQLSCDLADKYDINLEECRARLVDHLMLNLPVASHSIGTARAGRLKRNTAKPHRRKKR